MFKSIIALNLVLLMFSIIYPADRCGCDWYQQPEPGEEGYGTPTYWLYDGVDSDHDGIADDLEFALAAQFRPKYMMERSITECEYSIENPEENSWWYHTFPWTIHHDLALSYWSSNFNLNGSPGNDVCATPYGASEYFAPDKRTVTQYDEPTIYYRVTPRYQVEPGIGSHIELEYWFYHMWNYAHCMGPGGGDASWSRHNHDWEHISIQLVGGESLVNGGQIILDDPPLDYTANRVYYAVHENGYSLPTSQVWGWREGDIDFQQRGGDPMSGPIVFPDHGSFACYPEPARCDWYVDGHHVGDDNGYCAYRFICCMCWEEPTGTNPLNYGLLSEQLVNLYNLHLDDDHPLWLDYSGKWNIFGEDGWQSADVYGPAWGSHADHWDNGHFDRIYLPDEPDDPGRWRPGSPFIHPPEITTLYDNGGNEMVLVWEPPPPELTVPTGYIIEWRAANSEDIWLCAEINTYYHPENTYTLHSLCPNHRYQVRIRSEVEEDCGYPAIAYSTTSNEGEPCDDGNNGGQGCPIVAVYDTLISDYVYCNNILARSIDSTRGYLKFDEFLCLVPAPQKNVNSYSMKIYESSNDLTNLDFLQLNYVQVPIGYEIGVTGNGHYFAYSISNAILPISAKDYLGKDILSSIAIAGDGKVYRSSNEPGYIIMEYDGLDDIKLANLQLIAPPSSKNYTLSGSGTVSNLCTIEFQPATRFGTDVWHKVKSFGPYHNLDNMNIFANISPYLKQNEDFKIKLSWLDGYMADFLSIIRTSTEITPLVYEIPLSEAIYYDSQDSIDVISSVNDFDSSYVNIYPHTDELFLTFSDSEIYTEDENYRYYLHSYGYYRNYDTQPPQINLVFPSGETLIACDSIYTIEWEANDNFGIWQYDLYFSPYSDTSEWFPIATGIPDTSHSLAWKVPTIPSEYASIKIIAIDYASLTGMDVTENSLKLTFCGNIEYDMIWPVDVPIVGDVCVNTGVNLWVENGADLIFYENSPIIVNGYMTAEGDSSDYCRFIPSDTTDNWWGIRVENGGSVELDYAEIQFAYDGISLIGQGQFSAQNCIISDNRNAGIVSYVSGSTVFAEYCNFNNNQFGVENNTGESEYQFDHCSFNENTTGLWLNNPLRLLLTSSTINENTEYGIYATHLEGVIDSNDFWGNDIYGIYLVDDSGLQDSLLITRNDIRASSNSLYGISCYSQGNLRIDENEIEGFCQGGIYLDNSSPILHGNYLLGNKYGVVYANYSGGNQNHNNSIMESEIGILNMKYCETEWGNAGHLEDGLNSFIGIGTYYINNQSSTTLIAENNFWGTSSPKLSKFKGSVDWEPFLKSNPNPKSTGTLPIPDSYELLQNYPNPFNSETIIRFNMPEPGMVKIQLYNILGQRIASLTDSEYPAGYHSLIWDGKDDRGKTVASGIYLYSIEVKNVYREIKKLTLVR